MRAIRLTRGIRVDGQLGEQVYRSVPAITGLVQQVPEEGAAATERTEAWIMFDEDNVYVAARLWDTAPPSEWVANEMRRDTVQLMQNDHFGVLFDTYYGHRNGFVFYTTPLGALADQQFTNEGNPNLDWNPVWDVRTGRFEGGWTVEMEIPFKSLRYRSVPTQLWGLQLRRLIRRKNEYVYLTPVPTIPVGGYGFSDVELSYGFGAQRRASGTFSVRAGSFWTGDIRTVAFNQGRVEILERLSVEPSVSVNWIDLPQGLFRTELARARINYSFTPRMFFSGLLQYNSSGDSLSTNLRLRWEYTPGSELFIVYTDDRDTDPLMPERFSELRNRGLVVKITRLFRF